MSDLLPQNATAFERAASETMDHLVRLAAGVSAIRTAKLVAIPDSFLPFLIYEYGLGPVSAYVSDQRFLIGSGVHWQRVRGTTDAVSRALSWLGYGGAIEEARYNRIRWNLFQIGLSKFRDAEAPDLENIEGVVAQSVAVRSRFYRGFFGHDIRELEWSRHKYSGARWSGSSGARLRADGAKWSFGRTFDFPLGMSRYDLIALGVWQEYPSGEVAGWGINFANSYSQSNAGWGDFTWSSTEATWNDYGLTVRANLIAAAMWSRPVWACFRRADNSVIGYRRARVSTPVVGDPLGPYRVAAIPLAPSDPGSSFYVEVRTDFGDGDGSTAAFVSLIWDAIPVDTNSPGKLWAAPGELGAGTEVSRTPINIPFGKTVRERVRFHLTF